MGLWSRIDAIDAPRSSPERAVQILLLKGECTGILTEEAIGVFFKAWCDDVKDPQSCA